MLRVYPTNERTTVYQLVFSSVNSEPPGGGEEWPQVPSPTAQESQLPSPLCQGIACSLVLVGRAPLEWQGHSRQDKMARV